MITLSFCIKLASCGFVSVFVSAEENAKVVGVKALSVEVRTMTGEWEGGGGIGRCVVAMVGMV